MEVLVPILFTIVFVSIFGFGMLGLVALVGPKVKNSKAKLDVYECGIPEQTTGQSKMPVKFYLTAILFILFDIEIIFLFPWAITYMDFLQAGHGLYILLGVGVFLAIFIIGLIWEIKSKALEWE